MACFNPFPLRCLLLLLFMSVPSTTPAPAARRTPIHLVGFVVCDTCQENRLSNFSLPIPGATVTLTCISTKQHSKGTPFTAKASTSKYGTFSFELPFSKPSLLRSCKVELRSSPFEACVKETRYSWKVLSPILSSKSKVNGHLAYSSGWLSYQSNTLPSFCALRKEGFTKKDHNSDQSSSKDKNILPQDFSFPSFLPPLPGTPTPSFPFNFFPPSFPIPGTTTPTSPFNIPGTPPLLQPPPIIPGFPPFPFPFPFPFFFPFPFVCPSYPNPFSTFPPLPKIEVPPLPPNPLSPTIPINPFNPPTPSFNVPPFLLPSPPNIQLPPLTPNPYFPTTPPNVFPPFNVPPIGFPIPPLSPIPISPSNPTNQPVLPTLPPNIPIPP